MDFQNRVGSKPGGGGVASSSETNAERRERLRKLALETIDLNTDPYFMKNHLGTYECKLCLTVHTNEGSYLAHTQGKKHQTNLARRAAKEARDGQGPQPLSAMMAPKTGMAAPKRTVVKIGRPGYKVSKVRDPRTKQLGLLFQIHYPEITAGMLPRHRFMSAFEQKVEVPDRAVQYLLFAAEPYETIAFKVPSTEIDKSEGRILTHWDVDAKQFYFQFLFRSSSSNPMAGSRIPQPSLANPMSMPIKS